MEIKPFDIYFGRIQKAGSNIRLELKKRFRQALEHRGVTIKSKIDIPMAIQTGEEEGCVVVKLYFHKEDSLDK